MKKWLKVLILLLICSCQEKFQTKENLILTESFSSIDDQIYFAYHNYIADTGESLIITDNNDPKIVEVSYNGGLVKTFGNTGKGPCEFTMVTNPIFSDTELYVYAVDKSKILVYDRSGDCKGEIPIQDFIWNMTTDGNFIYAFTIRENEEGLIKKYDMEGEFIKSFGNSLSDDDSKLKHFGKNLNNLSRMMIYDNKLWLLHLYYPVLKVYSLDGMLLHNYILTEYFDYQERLENSHTTAKSSNSSGTQHIFKSLTVNKMGVFLGLHAPDEIMIVDHFNHNLNPVIRYQSDTEAFYHFDSVVVDSTIFANGANPETGLFKFLSSSNKCNTKK